MQGRFEHSRRTVGAIRTVRVFAVVGVSALVAAVALVWLAAARAIGVP